MILKVKRIHELAQMPYYATDGAACFDLATIESGVVRPGKSVIFRTGLSIDIEQGVALMIYSRSGHGFKSDVSLANATGVIDSDYRGEILIKLINHGDKQLIVESGDRIAQGMLIKAKQAKIIEVDFLGGTVRGDDGFGSTGR